MTPHQSTTGFDHARCAALVGVLCLTSVHALAQAEPFPIEGGNGSTVQCQAGGAIERTGRRYGAFPTTVTGCILAADAPFGLPGLSFTFYCRGGFPVQFHPATGRLRSCTLNSNASLPGTTNAPLACREGLKAEFSVDGRVASCNLPNTTPPGGTGGGSGGTINPPLSQGGHPPVVVGGESAMLSGGGSLTLIGTSSNRPGSRGGYLYLGDGRASATYAVQAPATGRYALWIRFDDDGQHPAGARGVEIAVNGVVALRWNNESRDLKGWTNIPVGAVDLRAGANTIVFTKAATTSAAFVLDEFVLSDQPGFVPQ